MSEAPVTAEVPEFDLADRLRKALRESKVSVGEMATYLEVDRNTVGNYINGRSTPNPATVMQFALRCKVPYLWLRDGIAGTGPNPGSVVGNRRHATIFRPSFASSVTRVDPLNDLSKAA